MADRPPADPIDSSDDHLPLGQVLDLLEGERRRMALALDEAVLNQLNLVLSQLQIYQQTFAGKAQVVTALDVLASLVRQIVRQTRDLQDGLQSAALDMLGLTGAIDMLADHLQRMRGVRVAVSAGRIELDTSTEMALIRTVQGVLDRAVRAGATRITLTLEDKRDTLTITITDDGLPLAEGDPLRIARLHAASTGAALRARAGNPRGTTVEIRLALAQTVTLTKRETQVLRLLVDGRSNPEIARALHVTVRTVKYHLDNLYSKLGARSRTDAVAIAVRRGLAGGPPIP